MEFKDYYRIMGANWNAGFEFSGGGFTGGDTADYSDFFESLFGCGFRPGDTGRAAFVPDSKSA